MRQREPAPPHVCQTLFLRATKQAPPAVLCNLLYVKPPNYFPT